MNGYIKLFRCFSNWRWYKDNITKSVFIHCLISANFTDREFENEVISKGSFVTSYKSLADDLHFTIQQIRTAIKKLKSTSEITIRTTNKYTVITVVNWEKYQDENEKSTSEITFRATNEQQTNNIQITNKQHSNNIQITNEQHSNNNKLRREERKKDIREKEKEKENTNFVVNTVKENSITKERGNFYDIRNNYSRGNFEEPKRIPPDRVEYGNTL